MTISKYNSEGYLDLTAHDALTAIETSPEAKQCISQLNLEGRTNYG